MDGSYPPIMEFNINIKKNKELNITTPRLPSFTDEEKVMVKGKILMVYLIGLANNFDNFIFVLG